ncbi:MAG: tyrosine-type recombinase/integrase [Phycisphaeraceae bacterium]|nr:MAG: tyrosine-type recombinase/integrase [Phycisphaeraceae bacterium]
MYPPLLTLAYTGLRREELAALDWENIDLETGLLTVLHQAPAPGLIHRKTTKGKQTRQVGLHNDVIAVRKSLPGPRTGPLFLTPLGHRLDGDRFLLAFKRDVRGPLAHRFPPAEGALGFKDAVIHSFRHFASDRDRREGVPEEIRMKKFGHKDQKTHAIYQHVTPREVADATRGLPSLVTPVRPTDAGPNPDATTGNVPGGASNPNPASGRERDRQ